MPINSPLALHPLVLEYILDGFRPELEHVSEIFDINPEVMHKGGETLIQAMFDKSKINMRMYGSAKELAEEIEKFKNFPGSDRFLKSELEPYSKMPYFYPNMETKGGFLCKSDLFVLLQNMVIQYNPEFQPLMITIISYFLKAQERKLGGKIEFVPMDEFWTKLEDRIQVLRMDKQRFNRHNPAFQKLMEELTGLDCPALFKKLQSMIPNTWNTDEKDRVQLLHAAFDLSLQQVDTMHAIVAKAVMFVEIKTWVKFLQDVINEKPEMFHLHSSTPNNKLPITVRLFDDGGKKFVMKAELYKAMEEDSGFEVDFFDDEDSYETIQMGEIMGKYADKFKNIKFIRLPIARTKHRAVPINGSEPGTYCILAVDLLLEYLKGLVFEQHLFQKGPPPCVYQHHFKVMEVFFKPEIENPHFLKLELLGRLKWAANIRIEATPVKTIRNAKKDGFTVQNLKNELEHLGLTVTFPEIQDHAEVVYAHVDKVKKEKYLRTCDLYDALEYCQLICVFEKLPKYKKFLHNQGGCGRVPGLKCDICGSGGVKKGPETRGSPDPLAVPEAPSAPAAPVTSSASPAPPAPESPTSTEPSSPASLHGPSQLDLLKVKITGLEAENSRQSSLISQLLSELLIEKEKSKKLQEESEKLEAAIEELRAEEEAE